jgi:hypothetical protein
VTAQTRPQHPGAATTARPPQVQPGHQQHYAPAGGQHDQPIAEGADHQLAMQRSGNRLQVVLRILATQQHAPVRIDEQIEALPGVVDDELRAAVRLHRR